MLLSLFYRFTAALGLLALLGGCCANNVCDCDDEQADAVRLNFSPAFSAAELDTIIIERTPRPFNPSNKVESVTIIRPAARVRDTLQINNNTPFTQAGTTKLDGYRYEVRYLTQPPRSKPVPTTVLVIDGIELRGTLEGDGCCTCYTNTQKTVSATRVNQSNPALNTAFVVDLKAQPTVEVTK